MPGTINPFTGRAKGWTWAQHRNPALRSAASRKAYGSTVLNGGTDYVFTPGEIVHAPFDGTLNVVGGQPVLVHPTGWAFCLLEMAHVVHSPGYQIKAGQELAVAGGKYPHAHGLTPAGKRVPWTTVYKKVRAYNERHPGK
ncbi:hypothetical protein QT381_02510 [Galbitalea sp. SE-J8]|uniref:hypothetical protein n=1 Tax=Galbitalea sp. SE-J8 TaxID=3054952 RepID=UPI00259CC82C|nr:hypothetical protein [Galbitalea sp. SE-J8]MDM4761875.1 hypothetical protein [Galbitalea sp. SE-J8]